MELEAFDKGAEHGTASRRGLEIFVHRDPGVQWNVDFRKDLDETWVLACQTDLTDANACAGADHGKLGEIAVGADFEGNLFNIRYFRIERTHPLNSRPDKGRLAVETDHAVVVE